MMAAWNKQHAAIITLLAFLAPMACHGGLLDVAVAALCKGGWEKLMPAGSCPLGSTPTAPTVPSPGPVEPTCVPSGKGLSEDFYSSGGCPAEAIVREEVEAAIKLPQGAGVSTGARLIRLHFHDCMGGHGCDASVLLNETVSGDNSNTEREAGPNINSLGAFEVIDNIKARLEANASCSGKVSCADILAFAARDAARSLSGGKIDYKVPGGRKDGRVSNGSEANNGLPGPGSDLAGLMDKFGSVCLNSSDLVALSGAHSIGFARCMFASSRPGMHPSLGNRCSTNQSLRVNQDYLHPNPDVLDKLYYDNVAAKEVLFDSDFALTTSQKTNDLVKAYKENLNNRFETDFGKAMVKMGNIILDPQSGEVVGIRKKCWNFDLFP